MLQRWKERTETTGESAKSKLPVTVTVGIYQFVNSYVSIK